MKSLEAFMSARNAVVRCISVCFAILMLIKPLAAAAEQDASIDRLLNRLPPPEKLVKPRVQKAVEKPDPALNDPLLKQTINAWDSRNYNTALTSSRQLAQKNNKSAFAHFLHGAVALDLNQWSEAAGAFRSSIAVQSIHPIVHLALGVTEMAQNHYAAALTSLKEAGRLEPTAAISWLLASQCAQRLGHGQESADLAKHGTDAEPNWTAAWIQLARAQQSAGHAPAALQALERASETDPDDADLLAVVGFSYINLNKIPQAIPPLERAAKKAPRDYLVQSQLGYCLLVTGQTEAALAYLRKGSSLNSKYGPVWEHLGFAYQKLGRHPDAIKAYERATQLMPESRLSWQHLAEEYRAVGRAADADRAAAHAGGPKVVAKPSKKS